VANLIIEKSEDGIVRLVGELDVRVVPKLLALSAEIFKQPLCKTIDLAGLSRIDSAGLALLTEWWRTAKIQQHTLRFIHAPPQVQALAHVSGLDRVLAPASAKTNA
jgi:phospholipid transport system transporter-binding protein